MQSTSARPKPTWLPLSTWHTDEVMGVSLNADGQLLASGGLGGTVRLWDARSSASVCTLRSDHRCERGKHQPRASSRSGNRHIDSFPRLR